MEIYFFIMIHVFWIRRRLPFKFFMQITLGKVGGQHFHLQLDFFFGRFLVSTRCRLPQIASGFASL